jgi:secreted trypsin-like serine protease
VLSSVWHTQCEERRAMRTADLTHLAFPLVASFAMFACAPGQTESDEYDDQESSDERDDEIIGGSQATAFPEAVLIDMKQGGVVTSICSGALIAPKVVLTAGHCVHGFTGWNIKAPFAQNQTATATSGATFDWDNDGEFVDPNQHDVGLIFLSKAINLASYPTVATSPVTIGSKVQNIGRINNGVASNTKLFIGPQVTTKNGSSFGFPFDYATSETIQSGDSGGPVIVPGTHKIVAVNSGSGGGTQVLARVDLVSSWIQENVASHGGSSSTPTDPCGGVTFEGQCNANTVVWCENNQLQQLACNGGKTCGFDSGNNYFNCL